MTPTSAPALPEVALAALAAALRQQGPTMAPLPPPTPPWSRSHHRR